MLSALDLRSQLAADDGGVLVMVAVWLVTLLLFGSFVIDVGNWFEHKRHLQLQADAGALAGGGLFGQCLGGNFATAGTAIEAEARRYAGSYTGAFNEQVGGSNRGTVHTRLNKKTFAVGGPAPDDTIESNPCEAGMLDVKLTEAGLPFFFGLAGSLVPSINARARVNIEKLTTTNGALPIGVPDVNPVAARVWFIDETTGLEIGSAPLVKSSTPSAAGLTIWQTDPLAPVTINVSSTTTRIGLRVALSGSTSTTNCGDALVECYDQVDTGTGMVYVRTWAATPAAAAPPDAPLARSVTLFSPGVGCADPYFHSDVTPCDEVGVRARIDYGALDRTKLKIFADSSSCSGANCKDELTYESATTDWVSTTSKAFVPIGPANGAQAISLTWKYKDAVTINGDDCSTGQGCSGTFEGGSLVQRTYGATDARSGPIRLLEVSQGASKWVNSLQRPAAGDPVIPYNLDVSVGIKASLGAAASVSDPIVALRVIGGGSQNQSLDCDTGYTTLSDELANGCRETYTINTGSPNCLTINRPTLWATAQPWSCVAIKTGNATNQVPAGLNTRILGDDKATNGCTNPNNWSMFPNLPEGDPRILQVFLTPFGAFSGSGSDRTVRVTDFATFYITGWTGQGSGFDNPCQAPNLDPAPDDDPVPNNDPATIVGHFIVYIDKLNTGGGSGIGCSFTSLGTCVLVLTK